MIEAKGDDPVDGLITDLTPEELAGEVKFTEYLEAMRDLGVSVGVVVGSKLGEGEGYIWNILSPDFKWNSPDPRTEKMSRLMHELSKSLAGILPLRMSNVLHDGVQVLIDKKAAEGVDTMSVMFDEMFGDDKPKE